MDFSTLVDYEKLHELELLHPGTEEPLGVRFWMRSIDSAKAERVLLENTDKQIERFAKRKLPTATQGKKGELERLAACVARWEWGEHTFEGTKPELSLATAVRVFEKMPWVERQAREAAESVKNFTMPSGSGSAAT